MSLKKLSTLKKKNKRKQRCKPYGTCSSDPKRPKYCIKCKHLGCKPITNL